VTPSYFSPDVLEFLALLARHDVRYLVVGGEAVIHYGHARLTGDIDLFYGVRPDNAERLFEALAEFWGDLSEHDLRALKEAAQREGLPYQTLLASVLHKYVTNQLVDEEKILKTLELVGRGGREKSS